MKNNLPTIGVLLGDPGGIGPELVVKLLSRRENHDLANVVILSDPNMLELGERVMGKKLAPKVANDIGLVEFEPGRPALVTLDLIAREAIEAGKATVASGRAVLKGLDATVAAAQRGALDGVVFAPLNKQAMRMAGLAFEDEMRYLQHLFAVKSFVTELNITGALWTSRVTSHIPLRDIADAITVEGVCNAIRIVFDNLRAAGVDKPKIAVAGLNPHAGDGGSYGMEEIEIIAPAVQRMQGMDVDAKGPYPADTVFLAARRGDFHAVVSMYHDQGQIAMKLMGFDQGVTLLAGLPVPFTTCASGSAFDIVGKGIANVEGLQQAFSLSARMGAAAKRAAAAVNAGAR